MDPGNKGNNNARKEIIDKIGTLIHCWWNCKKVQPLWKKFHSSQNLNVELPYDPAFPFLGELKTKCSKKNLYTNVHSSIIHNSQKGETTQSMSIN